MKRIILITLAVIITLPVIAQQNKTLFDQLTEKYADKSGFSASMLTNDLFDLYLKKKDIDKNSPVYTALKELDAIMVISQSTVAEHSSLTGEPFIENQKEKADAQKKERDQLFNEIIDFYKNKQYTLFKTENRLGEDLKVYLKKENDLIVSLALITNSSLSTNLVELDGDIDLTTVAELNKTLNLKGLENLYKLDNGVQYFGNYDFNTGSFQVFELAEKYGSRQNEFIEQQLKLTEAQRSAMEKQVHDAAEKQAQFAMKIRQMTETYGRQPIFLSPPGDTNTVYFINGKKVNANEIKELDKNTISSIEVKKGENEDEKTEVKIKTQK